MSLRSELDDMVEVPTIVSKSALTKQTWDRSLLFALLLIVFVLVASTIFNQNNVEKVNAHAASVAHTQEVLEILDDLMLALVDSETGQRGYLLTSKKEFLEPYFNSSTRAKEKLEALREKTLDNLRQSPRIERLSKELDLRFAVMAKSIELSRTKAGLEPFLPLLEEGKKHMDLIRKLVGEMRAEELSLLQDRRAQNKIAYRAALTSGYIAGGCGFIAIGAFVWLLSRNLATRRKAAEIIREQHQWLLTTLASIGDAVIATDNKGKVTFLNSVAQDLTGWMTSEALGAELNVVFNIVNEQTRRPVESPVTRVLREGNIVGLANHTILIAKDGLERPIDDSAAPIRDQSGAIAGVVMVFRDVGDKRIVESEISRSQARYKALVQATAQVVWTTDPTGKVVEDSPSWRSFTGQSLEQWLGTGWLDAVHPDDRERAKNSWTNAVKTQTTYLVDYRLKNNQGEYRDTIAKGVPVKNEKGDIIEWVGMNMDVTDQRRTDEQLRDTQTRFRLMADSIPQLAWMARPNGHVYWYNQRWFDYTGTTPEEMEKGKSRQFHDPNYLPSVLQRWKHCLKTGEIFDMVFPLRGKDGRFRLFLTRVMPLRAGDGTILHWFGTNTDVSEIREMGEALKESEQRFRLLAQTIPSIVWTAAPEGAITWANDQWDRYFGTAPDRTNPNWPEVCIPTDDLDQYISAWKDALRNGTEFEFAARNRRFDGQYRWFVTRATPVKDNNGAVTAWFGITTDIHDQKEMQETLKEVDRHKDEFLATLAHELRNPLAPIRNGLQLLRISDDRKVRDDARHMMERQLTQMVRLVDDLLDISRINRGMIELRREPTAMKMVIDNAVETSLPLIQEAAHTLKVELPHNPIYVLGDLTRLAQVVSNLLNNSAKYTAPGGNIHLSVESYGKEVVIRVRDNGVGIPAHMLPKVFEMFTQVDRSVEKAQGGLGIGLTLVQTLVQLHGGSIEAHSDGLGAGSEFIVRLPIFESAKIEKPQEQIVQDSKGTGRKVLIVDDNKDATQSLGMLLKFTGHEVRTANDGPEALECARTFLPEIVLLDIGLPGMSGYEVAKQMRQMPELKDLVLVAQTGWGQEEDRRRSKEAGFDYHLVKPVEPTLLQTILSENRRPPA